MRHWQRTSHFDIGMARLADDHYSRRTKGSRQIRPPGRGIHLYVPGPLWPFRVGAGWVWWTPFPGKAKRYDGYDGWYNCSFFRNESPLLSSELIREAVEWALEIWGPPEHGYDTYVWPAKVKSPNPGYCYLCAGWQRDGWSKDGKKRRLYLPLENVTVTP